MRNPTPDVGSKYGAPMGRGATTGTPEACFNLVRVPINSGGYDRGGAYWGIGDPLYYYESGEVSGHVRGRTRATAKAEVRKDYPNAKFYR